MRVNKTELGNGHSIAVLTAPENGTIRVFAVSQGAMTRKPATASFSAKINGVPTVNQSDYDFNNYHFSCDVNLPVNKNTTITFESWRNNSSANETLWEMWLEFSPI